MKKKTLLKLLPILLIVGLLIVLTVSGAFAFLVDSTSPLKNSFQTTRHSASMSGQYAVTNNGAVPSLARVKLIVNWVDDSGNVLPFRPEGASYAWTAGTGWTHLGSWTDPSDGYWYYNEVLTAGSTTPPVLSAISVKGGMLEVKLIAETIQAAPAEAAQEAWPEAVYQDGAWKTN